MNKSVFALALFGTASCITIVPSAHGQSIATNETRDASIEEITVTARKRTESLIDVPLAISAVNSRELERRGIEKIDALSESIPNITIAGNPSIRGSLTTWIRGIGQRAVEPLDDPANALSLDGVYFAGVSGAVLDTFDIEQVEVLRGPQGTLQGRNATGGAINLTSKRPNLTESGLDTDVEYSRFQTWTVKATAETPLIRDKLAFKVAVMSTGGDGYIKHLSPGPSKGDLDYSFGRVGLMFEPTDNFNAYLTADFSDDHSSQPDNIPRNGDPAVPRAETQAQVVPVICSALGDCRNFARNTYDSNDTKGIHTNSYGSGLTINWDVGPVGITSVTGYRKIQDHADLDIDATALDIASVQGRVLNTKQLSEEVRVGSRQHKPDSGGMQRLDWVIGEYHLQHDFDFEQPISLAALGLPIGPSNPPAQRAQNARSDALFVNADYSLTDTWHVFGGARQQWDKKVFTSTSPPIPEQQKNWSKAVFEGGVKDYVTAQDVVYFRFAQGTRVGGFTPSGATYEPEKVNSWEIGSNEERFNRKLIMRTALFYYQYKQMQRDVTIAIPVPPFFEESVKNAADATIWGAELEATAIPVDQLRLNLSLGYLNAKYNHYIDINSTTGLPVDDSRLRMPFTPKLNASLSSTYTVHAAMPLGFSQVQFGLDVSFKTAQNVGVSDLPFADQGAYALVNSVLQISDSEDRHQVELYVNNLADKAYYTSAEPISGLGSYVVYGLPRWYGIRARFKFGAVYH